MDSLGVGVEGEVGRSHEVLENLVVAADHPAGIEEIKVGHGLIDLQDMGLKLPRRHDRDVLDLVHRPAEGYHGQLGRALHAVGLRIISGDSCGSPE